MSTDTSPPKAMDPATLRSLAKTPTGRSMIDAHLVTLRNARAEFVDRNHARVESIRAELVKAEAMVAYHLATVDAHIAACEAALAATMELQA